jgi:hypothetical protein
MTLGLTRGGGRGGRMVEIEYVGRNGAWWNDLMRKKEEE